MKKEKFIEKVLIEEFDKDYFSFSNFTVEKRLIEKAMKYRNWNMFLWGMTVGTWLQIIIYLLVRYL
jgi:hypothetical protein